MAALPRVVPLRGGGFLPTVGLGVYRAAPSETEACVTSALELGYRHVDTAQVYGNEAEVGRAVTAFELGDLQRSALKHWRQHQAAPPGVEKEPTEAETQAFFRPVFITTKARVTAVTRALLLTLSRHRCGKAPGATMPAWRLCRQASRNSRT